MSPKFIKVKIKCRDNGNGTYEVGSYESDSKDNDKMILDPGYSKNPANCEDVRAIRKKLEQAYPDVLLTVEGPCKMCFEED